MHGCVRKLESNTKHVYATGNVYRCVQTSVRACAILQYVGVSIHVALFAMIDAEVRAYTEV